MEKSRTSRANRGHPTLGQVASSPATLTVYDERVENQETNQLFSQGRSPRLNRIIEIATENVMKSVNGTIKLGFGIFTSFQYVQHKILAKTIAIPTLSV